MSPRMPNRPRHNHRPKRQVELLEDRVLLAGPAGQGNISLTDDLRGGKQTFTCSLEDTFVCR